MNSSEEKTKKVKARPRKWWAKKRVLMLVVSSMVLLCMFPQITNFAKNSGANSQEIKAKQAEYIASQELAFRIFFQGSSFLSCSGVRSIPFIECKKKQNYVMYITTLALMAKNMGHPIFGLRSKPISVYDFPQFEMFYGSVPEGYGSRDMLSEVEKLIEKFSYSSTMEGASYLARCLREECSKIIRFAKFDGVVWSRIWQQATTRYSCNFQANRAKRGLKLKKDNQPSLPSCPQVAASENDDDYFAASWDQYAAPNRPPSF